MINDEVKRCIDKSVLCWLATSNTINEPNVSPKEIFSYQNESTLLIANIASPNSIRNIMENPKVCVTLIDIFTQKGFKIKGDAKIIHSSEPEFFHKKSLLSKRLQPQWRVLNLIEISVTRVDPVAAPSYFLDKGTTEESQVQSAMKTYGVMPLRVL